jgi:hypothetical protein
VARTLLIVTAFVETPIGLMLLVSPALVVAFLLGVSLDAPAALIVGRIAGAALLSLGGVCWLARDDGPSRARRGLVAAMLLYNCAAGAVLASAAAGEGQSKADCSASPKQCAQNEEHAEDTKSSRG